jgi:hypothetical protein
MAQADIPGADRFGTGPRRRHPAQAAARGHRHLYHENVAYLHRDCVVYRAEGFQALAKIRVTCAGQDIEAVLNVVDDDRIVATDELGLSEQAFAQPVGWVAAQRKPSKTAGALLGLRSAPSQPTARKAGTPIDPWS